MRTDAKIDAWKSVFGSVFSSDRKNKSDEIFSLERPHRNFCQIRSDWPAYPSHVGRDFFRKFTYINRDKKSYMPQNYSGRQAGENLKTFLLLRKCGNWHSISGHAKIRECGNPNKLRRNSGISGNGRKYICDMSIK